jgi:hypothetical protein
VEVTSSRDLASGIGGPAIVMGWATKVHKVVYVLVIVWHASVIGRHTLVIGLYTLVIGWHALVIELHTTFIGWHVLVI